MNYVIHYICLEQWLRFKRATYVRENIDIAIILNSITVTSSSSVGHIHSVFTQIVVQFRFPIVLFSNITFKLVIFHLNR